MFYKNFCLIIACCFFIDKKIEKIIININNNINNKLYNHELPYYLQCSQAPYSTI